MDSGISPDTGNQDPTSSGSESSEVCVPTADITIEGNAPQPGDTVSFAIDAKVTRAEGDMTYVQPTSVNGQPVTQEAQPTPDSSEPQFDDSGNYMSQ